MPRAAKNRVFVVGIHNMNIARKIAASSLMALAALAGTAQTAQANLLNNGSFENPNRGSDTYCYMGGSCATDSWTGGAVIIAMNSGAWGWPNQPAGYAYGQQLISLQNSLSVSQTVSLAAGQYTLDWADSGRSTYYGSYSYGAAEYQVYFDNQLLGTYNVSPGEAWARNSLSFTASGAGELRFQGVNLGGDTTAFVDDLRLTAAVPEPQSLAMVLLGLAVVGAVSRRKSAR